MLSPSGQAVAPVERPSRAATWMQVPALAQMAISRALGRDERGYWATKTRSGLAAQNARNGLAAVRLAPKKKH